MDPMELGEMSGGCEEAERGLASGFPDDCSIQESHMDGPMFGLSELVCVTVVYVPLMLFGLLGNILTILVVWLRPHMRSSTYLYLSSMAVSDLLILLLLPLDLYKLWRPRPWPFGDLVCKLTMFLSECCTFCTILHITFLSLERYVAVCWPIAAKTLVTRRRTRAVIGCLWLGAAVSAAPVLVMVGVEDVGGEEHRLAHWKEDGGWTGWEAEQGGLVTGGREGEGGHMALLGGGMEGAQWEVKEKGWGEVFGGKEEGPLGEHLVEDGAENQAEGGGDGSKHEGVKRHKKEDDEGGGREGNVPRCHPAGTDLRECRCTDYAVSSGLLSAMMIVSNLYFLVPLCVLGLVYSLIGRALCLRPKSSRKDQSHRHTVRMLGVIVLAFVLCWLPFHVGRTIFSLSMGAGADQQETYADFNPHLELNRKSDFDVDTRNTPTRPGNPGYSDTTSSETLAWTMDGDEAPGETSSQTDQPNTATPFTGVDTPPFDPLNNVTGSNSTGWLPDPHAYFLYYLSQYFNLVSSVLFYLSAAVNPLLYNLMSARYRLAVHSLVHAHAPAQRLRTLSTRHSTTTL